MTICYLVWYSIPHCVAALVIKQQTRLSCIKLLIDFHSFPTAGRKKLFAIDENTLTPHFGSFFKTPHITKPSTSDDGNENIFIKKYRIYGIILGEKGSTIWTCVENLLPPFGRCQKCQNVFFSFLGRLPQLRNWLIFNIDNIPFIVFWLIWLIPASHLADWSLNYPSSIVWQFGGESERASIWPIL